MSSIVKVDTIQENTSANGITVDGLNIKDSKLVTADSVVTNNITANAVTYAKIQNVSATDRILGRDSSGAGVIEEITPANLRTMLNVADGATAGGGKLLQVVHAHTATIANSSSTSYADTGLTASITPSATSSKVIIIINQSVAKMGGANSYGNFRVYRDSTEIGGAIPARALGSTNDTGEIYLGMPFNYNFQDSPSSTSSVTYKTQFNNGAGTGTIRCQPDSSQSYILLMEVAG